MYFCHLYGMGFCCCSLRIQYVFYMFSVCVNLSITLYMYRNVFVYMQSQMPQMFDVSTIMSVVRVNFRFLASSLMILFMSINNTAILNCVNVIDRLDLSIRDVSLKPFVLRFVGWLTITMALDSLQMCIYHIRTNFKMFSVAVFLQFFFCNVWIITPILFYTLIVSIICHEARNINDNVTSITAWRTYRPKWKELQSTAISLTKSEFGVMIIVFITWTIIDITFFCFATYLTWRLSSELELFGYVLLMTARAGLMFQLFRECHNCKIEVN